MLISDTLFVQLTTLALCAGVTVVCFIWFFQDPSKHDEPQLSKNLHSISNSNQNQNENGDAVKEKPKKKLKKKKSKTGIQDSEENLIEIVEEQKSGTKDEPVVAPEKPPTNKTKKSPTLEKNEEKVDKKTEKNKVEETSTEEDLSQEIALLRLQKKGALETIAQLEERIRKFQQSSDKKIKHEEQLKQDALKDLQAANKELKECRKEIEKHAAALASLDTAAKEAKAKADISAKEQAREAQRAQQSSQVVARLQGDISTLQAQLAKAQAAAAQAPKVLPQPIVSHAKCKEETDRLREETNTLSLQLNAQTAASNALGALKTDLEGLLKQAREQLIVKTHQVDNLLEARDKLQSQLENGSLDWTQEKEELVEKLANAELLQTSLSEQLQAAFAQHDAQCEVLNNKISLLEADKNTIAQELQKAVHSSNQLQAVTNQQDAKDEVWKTKIADLEEENSSLSKLLQAATQAKADLQASLGQHDAHTETWKTKVGKLEEEKDVMSKELEACRHEMNALQARLDQQDTETDSQTEDKTKITALEKENSSLSEQLSASVEAETKLKGLYAGILSRTKELEELLKTKEEALEEAQSRCHFSEQEKQSAIDALEAEFEASKKTMHEQYEKEKTLFIEHSNDTLKLEKKKSKAKLDKLTEEREGIREELQKRFDEERAELIAKYQEKIDGSIPDKEKLHEQMTVLNREKEQLEASVASLQTQIATLQSENAELMKHENDKKSVHMEMSKKLELLKTEKATALKDAANFEELYERNKALLEKEQARFHEENLRNERAMHEFQSKMQDAESSIPQINVESLTERIQVLEKEKGDLAQQLEISKNVINMLKNKK